MSECRYRIRTCHVWFPIQHVVYVVSMWCCSIYICICTADSVRVVLCVYINASGTLLAVFLKHCFVLDLLIYFNYSLCIMRN